MSDTRIVAVDIRPFDVPLFAPFGVATGAQVVARNVLVTVTLASGTQGFGEGAPFPAVTGETQEHCVAALETAKDAVLGEDAGNWRHLAARIRSRTGPHSSGRCALETAILDAFTKACSMSLVAFFGGRSHELVTDMTITTGSIKEAEKAANDIQQRGIRAIKLKIGSQDLDLEIERISRVRKVAPGSPLILDGNCAYDARTALRLLDLVKRRSIEIVLFEQPVGKDDLEGMKKVATEGEVPVAADESVESAEDALTIVRRGIAQVINIKLMKSGIAESLDIAAIARASGTRLMIGGMIETRLAMGMSACFAAGQGGFDFIDLDTPLFLAQDPFEGGYELTGDRIDLRPVKAGHGLAPRANFFAKSLR